MKVAIIGGAGVRVPLLVRGLVRSDLDISDVALFDTDTARLALIEGVTARVADGTPVRSYLYARGLHRRRRVCHHEHPRGWK